MHDPAALAEWESHNVIPMAGFSTPEYSLMCNTSEPVTELGALVQELGGVPTSSARSSSTWRRGRKPGRISMYAESASSALEAAKEAGQTEVVQPGESLQKAVDEWIANGVVDRVGIARDTYKGGVRLLRAVCREMGQAGPRHERPQ